jgi:hypothetical protein
VDHDPPEHLRAVKAAVSAALAAVVVIAIVPVAEAWAILSGAVVAVTGSPLRRRRGRSRFRRLQPRLQPVL